MRTFVAFVLLALSLAGCATQTGTVSVPVLPAWIAPADATSFPALRVVAEIRQRVPGCVVNYSDTTYTLVAKQWLDEYLDWEWNTAKLTGITYMPESFDCDKFSLGFSFFVYVAASRTGQHTSPLVARLVVQYDATSRHELCGVATDQGLFVVEPQPAAGPFRVTPLAQYDKPILSVTLGDYNPGGIGAGSSVAYLPDPRLTPGATLPVTAGQLVAGYASKVRNVPASEKRKVYAEYGITTHRRGEYEVDHLISLELGGSNDIRNLWPESYAGTWNAHLKDRLENELHRRVVSGQMPLAEAQRRIAVDWIKLYCEIFPADVVDGVPKPVGRQPNAQPDND